MNVSDMNEAQTIFTILFALYFSTVVGLTRPLEPFDTASMSIGQGRAWGRFLVSFALLNLVPIFYFALIYWWLGKLTAPDTLWNTSWVFLGLLLLSLPGFGLYRVLWGLMLLKRKTGEYLFYGKDLPCAMKERIDQHLAGGAAARVWPQLGPGIVWTLLSVLLGYFFIACLSSAP